MKLDERFFESTRGRIVQMLRGKSSTVNELAEKLGLTDNAVRAQLLALERDGVIKQSGVQRGFRKPHFAYELTPEAERLFPKAYDLLLNSLISALKGRYSAAVLKELLREVGQQLAKEKKEGAGKVSMTEGLERATKILTAMGGAPWIESADGKLSIRSSSCPLSAAVIEHPEICELARALIAELVGAPVYEHCDRSQAPRCCFEIKESTKRV
jgi:predicted ArsR family transcriptional regulator